jgi:hypothetical protein
MAQLRQTDPATKLRPAASDGTPRLWRQACSAAAVPQERSRLECVYRFLLARQLACGQRPWHESRSAEMLNTNPRLRRLTFAGLKQASGGGRSARGTKFSHKKWTPWTPGAHQLEAQQHCTNRPGRRKQLATGQVCSPAQPSQNSGTTVGGDKPLSAACQLGTTPHSWISSRSFSTSGALGKRAWSRAWNNAIPKCWYVNVHSRRSPPQ